jgi:RHS repeat-associated protein
MAAGGMVFSMQVTRSGNLAILCHHSPWGKRRSVNGLSDVTDSLTGQTTDRGFTMHEHLDEMGVVHMNGRIYDPLIGRFMSADPILQAPGMLQSHNRYAYVMNNPLNLTDPSGFSAWTSFRDKWLRPIVAIAVAIYAPQFFATYGFAGASPALAGFVNAAGAGFVAGAVSSGTFKGAAQGALTAGLFHGAGLTGPGGGVSEELAARSAERYIAHAAAGCVSSVAGGGSCGQGAASGIFGKFATNNLNFGGVVANGVAAAVAGGVGSALGGGKFANGAETAAFGYLFNQMSRGAGLRGLNSAPVNDPLDPETLDRRTNRGFVALDRLITRADDGGPQEYQYALVAQRDGMYPNVRTPGIDMHLNAGDTWKIGTSIDPDHRYSQSYLNSLNVRMVPETTGSAFTVLVQEKIRLLGYMLTNFNLPPGNKILK